MANTSAGLTLKEHAFYLTNRRLPRNKNYKKLQHMPVGKMQEFDDVSVPLV